jgi:hypothetical protein
VAVPRHAERSRGGARTPSGAILFSDDAEVHGACVALKARVVTCALAGLAYGALLAWLATGAAGYADDSLPLSLVLMFVAGFPVSLPLCAFDGYFLGLGAPLFWAAFGALVSHNPGSGRALRSGRRLLLVHYIGLLVGMLAVPWAVESSAHLPARTISSLVVFLVVYTVGQVSWWRTLRLLDRLREGGDLPRPARGPLRLGRLVAGALALTFAFVAFAEHETLTIACRRDAGDCEVHRQGWRNSTRRVPMESMKVTFGVPRSRLEVVSSSRTETLIGVGCTDRKTGLARDAFGRCESRAGRLLSAMNDFLAQKRGAEVRIVDDDPWPSRTVAVALLAFGVWLVISAFVTLQERTTMPAYRPAPRPPAPGPPMPRPPAGRAPTLRPPSSRPPADPRRSR